jgi:hypothetical protein
MKKNLLTLAVLVLGAGAAFAEGKSPRFLNRTDETITHLQLAPAGTTAWGEDLCKYDDEGAVEHNERLNLVGVKSGRYDVKLADKKGRTCTIKNINVQEGAQFIIHEADVASCGK